MNNENKQNFFNSESLLSFILSCWKPLLVVALIAAVGSAAVSYLLPIKFKATVTVFPSQNNNLSRGFYSQLSDNSKDYLGVGENSDAEQLLQVFKSDELMYILAKKFDLLNYYKLNDEKYKYYMFKGYYNDLFVYGLTEYQSIKIEVYDQNPGMAADMANAAAHIADSLLQHITKQRAIAAFKVVKAQYDSAIAVANKLEDSMNFYRNQGILSWDYQIKEYTSGYSNAEIKGDAGAVSAISDKLKAFQQYGKGFSVIYNDLFSTYKWLIIARESYMEAKTNAEETIPALYIVDKAVPADRKTYPIRGLVVIGGTIASVLFAILVLLMLNRFRTKRADDDKVV